MDSTSRAAFGQLSANLTDTLKWTAGVRYTKDTIVREGTFDLFLHIVPGPGNILVTPDVNGRAESSKTTWMTGLDWQIGPANLLYGKVSTGYKAGGFTGAGSYAPESVTAYELGSKNRFRQDTLQANAAVYYMSYTNQQLNQFSDPVAGAQTVNADSRIYGLEASLTALVDRADRVTVSGNYLHARVTGFVPPPGYNPAVSQSIVGNRLPLSPTVALTAQVEHVWTVPWGTVTARAMSKFESEKYFSANNFASTHQPGYATEDASVEYEPGDGRWSIQVYGRNLTNRAVLIDADENYVAGTYQYAYAAPRTFGVGFWSKFD